MNMKEHILAALKEQFDRWEKLLASLPEEQISAPQFDHDWSIKDVIAHLWEWQQISIVRMKGGVQDREPEFPIWITELGEGWEDEADRVNTLIVQMNREKPWLEIYESWRAGFLHLLEIGGKLSERDLLDGDRYPWLHGYTLASVLVASYDHHQEHFEKLFGWLQEQNHE